MTVQRETSCANATAIPSRTAIQRAILIRRARSQRPVRLDPCSIVPPCSSELSYAIVSTVPSRHRDPSPPAAEQLARCRGGGPAVQKEAVDRGTGAADVGAEGAERLQFLRHRRRGE